MKKEEGVKDGRWIIHVFSFRGQEKAKVYKEKLMAAGFPAYSIPAEVKGEFWIRVHVGFFNSQEEAQEVSKEIQKKSISQGPFWITKVSVREKENIRGN
ncbi:MAG: SPOR domain-containing protein [Deltaproteobacteria bacterium]|nr:SPOR domain-containing protein [Deltaproteobacteria bacterium]